MSMIFFLFIGLFHQVILQSGSSLCQGSISRFVPSICQGSISRFVPEFVKVSSQGWFWLFQECISRFVAAFGKTPSQGWFPPLSGINLTIGSSLNLKSSHFKSPISRLFQGSISMIIPAFVIAPSQGCF